MCAYKKKNSEQALLTYRIPRGPSSAPSYNFWVLSCMRFFVLTFFRFRVVVLV